MFLTLCVRQTLLLTSGNITKKLSGQICLNSLTILWSLSNSSELCPVCKMHKYPINESFGNVHFNEFFARMCGIIIKGKHIRQQFILYDCLVTIDTARTLSVTVF